MTLDRRLGSGMLCGNTPSGVQPSAVALGLGWHLATITSAREDALVASQLTTAWAERSHFWLGATDAVV